MKNNNTNKPTVPEQAEQKALVTRCKMENIEIIGIENSLQFPINAVLDIVKPYLSERELQTIKKRLQMLMATLTQKRYAQGMKAGCPDLFFPELHLFIELKRRDGGVVSEVQKETHKMLRKCGFRVEVAYGAGEAYKVIQEEVNKRKEN